MKNNFMDRTQEHLLELQKNCPKIKEEDFKYNFVYYPIILVKVSMEQKTYEDFNQTERYILEMISSGVSIKFIVKVLGLGESFVMNKILILKSLDLVDANNVITSSGSLALKENFITKINEIESIFQIDGLTKLLLPLNRNFDEKDFDLDSDERKIHIPCADEVIHNLPNDLLGDLIGTENYNYINFSDSIIGMNISKVTNVQYLSTKYVLMDMMKLSNGKYFFFTDVKDDIKRSDFRFVSQSTEYLEVTCDDNTFSKIRNEKFFIYKLVNDKFTLKLIAHEKRNDLYLLKFKKIKPVSINEESIKLYQIYVEGNFNYKKFDLFYPYDKLDDDFMKFFKLDLYKGLIYENQINDTYYRFYPEEDDFIKLPCIKHKKNDISFDIDKLDKYDERIDYKSIYSMFIHVILYDDFFYIYKSNDRVKFSKKSEQLSYLKYHVRINNTIELTNSYLFNYLHLKLFNKLFTTDEIKEPSFKRESLSSWISINKKILQKLNQEFINDIKNSDGDFIKLYSDELEKNKTYMKDSISVLSVITNY